MWAFSRTRNCVVWLTKTLYSWSRTPKTLRVGTCKLDLIICIVHFDIILWCYVANMLFLYKNRLLKYSITVSCALVFGYLMKLYVDTNLVWKNGTLHTVTDNLDLSCIAKKLWIIKELFWKDLNLCTIQCHNVYDKFIHFHNYGTLLLIAITVHPHQKTTSYTTVIDVCLLVCEEVESITWMIDTFKQYNSEWQRIRVVMTDKNIQEHDINKQCLPSTSVLICPFHTPHSFWREISCESRQGKGLCH